MQTSELAIGVFDSGMGGLTVLSALREILPRENFIYLGDTARLPYGTKSAETVQQYAVQMTRILVEQDIKALVIACNTATTAALPHLQMLFPNLCIIGVVEPGAQAAVAASTQGQILVMATETTIASQAYQRAIQAQQNHAQVQTRACSLLVALAEEGMVNHDIAQRIMAHYLQNLAMVDTILLGCTHFPVFRGVLQQLMPTVQVVDSAMATAKMLQAHLFQSQLLSMRERGQVKYMVTDAIGRFCRIGEIFLQQPIDAQDVSLIDA